MKPTAKGPTQSKTSLQKIAALAAGKVDHKSGK